LGPSYHLVAREPIGMTPLACKGFACLDRLPAKAGKPLQGAWGPPDRIGVALEL
jgi:hypothetical protein